MALQEKEGTTRKVLDKIRVPGGAKAGYVKIGRVDIDFTANTYTALILSYASEEARSEDIQNGHPYFIGGPLTDEQAQAMKTHDVRDVLYEDIQRLIPEHADGSQSGRIG